MQPSEGRLPAPSAGTSGSLSPGPPHPVLQPGAPRAAPHPSCAGADPRLHRSARSIAPENPAFRTAVHPGAPASNATHLMWAQVLPQRLHRRARRGSSALHQDGLLFSPPPCRPPPATTRGPLLSGAAPRGPLSSSPEA
ncbi:hypothetical protein NDU88_001200 [Pleurodeles waltl]|uniref:Uncharacterized protein n=1 Tax=Pleurodeles waltl TaxID=8319 RepID=A0AAV7Q300_PLEWA|nr:hypothetical protein NDU88_001200 [Pleurodeles waltl]